MEKKAMKCAAISTWMSWAVKMKNIFCVAFQVWFVHDMVIVYVFCLLNVWLYAHKTPFYLLLSVCSEHEQLVGDQCVSVSKEESEDSCLKINSHKYPQAMSVGLSYDTAQTAVQYVGFSLQLNGSSNNLCFRQGELRTTF